MAEKDDELRRWLDLADEVARRHRQGHVLAADPALVLRGLPVAWRPAGAPGAEGAPADDVLALAGAALERIRPDDDLRAVLVEAAAGCLGSDLPALLRNVRAVAPEALTELPSPATAADDPDDRDGSTDPAPRAGRRRRRSVVRLRTGRPDGAPTPGRRLALAGGVTAGLLGLLGTVGAWPGGGGPTTDIPSSAGGITAPDPGDETAGQRLAPSPLELGGSPAVTAAWDAPHLLIDVDGTRYRYRLEGPIDGITARTGPDGIELEALSGGQAWPLAVPALAGSDPGPDADEPGTTGSS